MGAKDLRVSSLSWCVVESLSVYDADAAVAVASTDNNDDDDDDDIDDDNDGFNREVI